MEEKLQNSEEDVALWNEYKKSRSPEIKEALIGVDGKLVADAVKVKLI